MPATSSTRASTNGNGSRKKANGNGNGMKARSYSNVSGGSRTQQIQFQPVVASYRQPQKKKTAKSLVAPKVSTWQDARIHRPLCICPQPSLGNYTALHLKKRDSYSINAMPGGSEDGILFYMGFSTRANAWAKIDVNSGALTAQPVDFATFDDLHGDAPITVRGSRKTLTLTLSTVNQDAGGVVYVCATANPLSLSQTGADLSATAVAALVDLAKNSHNSRQMSAVDFQKTQSFSLGFASAMKGSEWQSFATAATASEKMTGLLHDAKLGAMSNLVIYWEAATAAQKVEVACTEQIATRYSGSHLLNSITQSQAGKVYAIGNQQQVEAAPAVEGLEPPYTASRLPSFGSGVWGRS